VSETAIHSALQESVREVLEKMFFVDLLQSCPCEPLRAGITAELSFEGDPPGSFRLALDLAAASTVAADFLGEDPAELSSEQMADVVCELANMICGSLLSRIESTAAFRLSKPSVISAESHPQTGVRSCFRALVGCGNLRAEIFLERPVCPEAVESAS
jgi:CheY-specific phosphatase CheX